jgi:hypothetical protein
MKPYLYITLNQIRCFPNKKLPLLGKLLAQSGNVT